MHYRTFGQIDRSVSEIGLGTWQLGADWGKRPDLGVAKQILEAAVAAGVNFFDTADVYGDGRSESLIGDFLTETGHDVFVATKYGRAGGIYPDGYSLEGMRTAVEASLKRLRTDAIDLLQLHCIPTELMRSGEAFGWLRQLREEGKIKHFGASIESVEEGMICLEEEGCRSLQIIFNIFRQKPAEQLVPLAKERGVGIIVRLPLASGLLTGKFNKSTTFPEEDHRNYNRDGAAFNVGETFAGLPFELGVELADELRDNFLPDHLDMVQFSLRWILDHPGVTTIIPGATSLDHVRGNAAASGLAPLDPSTREKLADFYQRKVHDHIRGPY